MRNRWEEVINAFMRGRANRVSYDSCEIDFTHNTITLRHGKYIYADKRDGFVTAHLNGEWPHAVKWAVACRINYLGSKRGFDRRIFEVTEKTGLVNLGPFKLPHRNTITLTFPPDVTSWDEWMAYRMMTGEQ